MPNPTQVTRSRFEIEQNGQTAWLEFDTDGQGWLTLWHTEVPEQLRGRGLAPALPYALHADSPTPYSF